jgi:hypothetical protein
VRGAEKERTVGTALDHDIARAKLDRPEPRRCELRAQRWT